MKRLIGLIGVICLACLIGFSANAGQTLPQSGEYEVVGGDSDLGPEIVDIQPENHQVIFTVPVMDSDPNSIDQVQLYVSYAWTNGQTWRLVAEDDYSVPTIVENGRLKAMVSLPEKGNGLFWLRIWGKGDKDWLWINQNSEYTRNDDEDNQGYEMVFSFSDQKAYTVPEAYQTRD